MIMAFAVTACGNRATNGNSIVVDFTVTELPEFTCKKIIPLETRQDALLGEYYNLYSTSKYYVAQDKVKIVVFDKSGKIHKVIAPIGRGANEVVSLLDIWPDETSIKIRDAYNFRMLEYDYEGKFVGAMNVDNHPTEFCVLNGEYLFGFQNGSLNDGNVLAVCDLNGAMIQSHIELVGEGILYGSEKFQNGISNNITYLPSFSNTVYSIDKSKRVEELYTFDFGKHWADKVIVNDFKNSANVFDLWSHLKESGMVGFLKFKECGDIIMLNFEMTDGIYNWFYDKSRGNQYLTKIKDDNIRSVAGSKVLCVDGNNFVFEILPFEYGKYGDLPEMKVDDSANPILFVGNLK